MVKPSPRYSLVRGRSLLYLGTLLAALACTSSPATAHPFQFTRVDVKFARDGVFQVDVTYHVDAMLADVQLGDLSEDQYRELRALPAAELSRRLEMVRRYFRLMIKLEFDGREVDPDVSFPNMESAGGAPAQPLPGHLVRLSGRVPAGAREFLLSPSPVFTLIVLDIRQEGRPDVAEQFIEPFEQAAPYRLDLAPPVMTRLAAARRYLALGFEHIIPRGLDHILFVLGLYLLSVRIGPLLQQVTAFTVAHTLTLALSMYGVFSLPSAVVEPLIALSIAYVAIENIFTSELKPWRPVVVFAFGLLHGLGFAGALRNLGLPRERFLTALLSFNAGVELGQITVITLAFLLVGWFLHRAWYRARVVIPASACIAMTGLYWAVQRVVG